FCIVFDQRGLLKNNFFVSLRIKALEQSYSKALDNYRNSIKEPYVKEPTHYGDSLRFQISNLAL
ncbi:MAG: hypothetical protein JJT78_05585, partial [Leptospira sp.]|nr:hypothetical protein [Leptospira sp.]